MIVRCSSVRSRSIASPEDVARPLQVVERGGQRARAQLARLRELAGAHAPPHLEHVEQPRVRTMDSEKLGGRLVHGIAGLTVQPEGLTDLGDQLLAFL